MVSMMGKERQIAVVKDNSDKQVTYREQLGKYKRALNNEFYFEALLIVYAVLEDRMRSFLYYIGAVRRADSTKLNVSRTKSILRRLYFGSDEEAEGKRIDLTQISAKQQLIASTITWTLEYEGVPEESYLAILKDQYESCLNMDSFLSTLDAINDWRDYRNEIIHGLLNKNVESINAELKEQVEKGMGYARFVDSQVKALKRKDLIRKTMKIKR